MVTLKSIAKTVGVSTTTVSRVLNFDSTLSITDSKRQAILETAEALNYATPRSRNRANQQGLSRIALVHFLSPDLELADPYYIGLRLGIERRCQDLRIETAKVYRTRSRPEASVLKAASGVIAIGSYAPAEIDWLETHSRHLVFADFLPEGGEYDGVGSDLAIATRKLLNSLWEMGYRRIGFVGWDEEGTRDPHGEVRCRTYKAWLKEHGAFDPGLCLTGASDDYNTERMGHQLTVAMLEAGHRPDVLVTCNDSMAVGAYKALHEKDLRIPDDVAVASFNDISVAQFLTPALSTVRVPSEEIGEMAVELLLERASGRDLAKRISLESRVIWRASTRAPVMKPK